MKLAPVILVALCFNACEANKRILLEDNYYDIVHRLSTLEARDAEFSLLKTQVAELEPLKSKVAQLELENGNVILIYNYQRKCMTHSMYMLVKPTLG